MWYAMYNMEYLWGAKLPPSCTYAEEVLVFWQKEKEKLI
jgi:hypothetical protein